MSNVRRMGADMAASFLKHRVVSLSLGVVVGVAALYSLGFTAAIASPAGLFDWFKSKNLLDLGLGLWHLVVVYGLGIGLPVFLVLFSAFRTFAKPAVSSALLFVLGVLLTVHVFYPLAYGSSLSAAFTRPWWGYGFELSLVVATGAALFVTRNWPNSSFKPTSLRDAA